MSLISRTRRWSSSWAIAAHPGTASGFDGPKSAISCRCELIAPSGFFSSCEASETKRFWAFMAVSTRPKSWLKVAPS
ncbi:hypothetical protein D3C72_796620 [compost metagenome]